MSLDKNQQQAEKSPAWYSMIAVIWSQAQNGFNDNLVKFVLVALATAVASHTWVGANIEIVASSIIPLPFILFAPIAGWLSDRYSKRDIMLWCVILQVVILTWMSFVTINLSINTDPKLASRRFYMAMIGFILLSIQSTFYSPAKLGIAKELVGASRVGYVSGWISMSSMIGILGGMILGGNLFAWLGTITKENPWQATGILWLACAAFSFIPLWLTWKTKKTPEQESKPFQKKIVYQHISHLKKLWTQIQLKRASLILFIVWLIAYLIGIITISMGKEIHPLQEGANFIQSAKSTVAAAQMYIYIGIGLVLGSLLVAFLSKKKIPLHLVPIGFLMLSLFILLIAIIKPQTLVFIISLGGIGFFSSFITAPMNAFLQNESQPVERGRIISANNLQVAIGGILAAVLLIILRAIDLSVKQQILAIIPIALFGAFYSLNRRPVPK